MYFFITSFGNTKSTVMLASDDSSFHYSAILASLVLSN